MTLSAVRPDGRRTYDVALRPLHDMRGDREVEIMRDDLVRILYRAVADDVEVTFGDSVRALHPGDAGVGVEFEHGPSQEVDLVVGADGHHSNIRDLAFGPEDRFTRHLGAYLSIFTVDNLLGLTDQAVLYNEPGRAAGMFTVRGNQRAKAVLMFRSEPMEIDFRDQAAQQALLRDRFAGMGWQTKRLVEAMRDAYDFYFDEMSQVKMPSWSAGRVALLGDAGFGPSPMSGQGTSLALIGAYLLAHHISTSPDIGRALALWERGFRSNVEQNQRLATHGMATLAARIAVRHLRAQPDDAGASRAGAAWARLRRSDRTGVSGGHAAAGAVSGALFGQVEGLEHLGRPQPDHQLARHAVAAAVLLGPVGTHVPGARTGGDVEKIVWIFTDRYDSLDLHERVGRPLVVHADHRAGVAGQRTAFGGVLAGVEYQLAAVHDKPDGCHQRSAVRCGVPEFPGAGALGDESDYVVGEFVHPTHRRAIDELRASPLRAARSPSAPAAPAIRARRARRAVPPGSGRSRIVRSWLTSIVVHLFDDKRVEIVHSDTHA